MDTKTAQNVLVEDDRTGNSPETLRRALLDNLFYVQGKFKKIATRNDWYNALSYTVRDRLVHQWLSTLETFVQKDVRAVCYLSAEFLTGPHLANNLVNMELLESAKHVGEEAGFPLDDLLAQEAEPGLGNGGLGRLAACYMDSLATLDVPAIGYGIRYEFGIFNQLINDGWQVECTDRWLNFGNPWEIRRTEDSVEVKFGGYSRSYLDKKGNYRVQWVPDRQVIGIPYDTPIPGYRTVNTSTLRLWKAEAHDAFDFPSFNVGDYYGAVNDKVISENISKVLYPNDEPLQGKELRLEQEYFFVACSLRDIIKIYLKWNKSLDSLNEKVVMQLNDTHPSIAVAEMMRLLVDEFHMDWDRSWLITQNIFAYTNHTLLPEAMERWPVPLFASLLPRHLEIIYEINRRFLDLVRQKYPGDEERAKRLSIIDESGPRYVRMAHLAVVGSHAVNGVAALHTDLLEKYVLKDFYELWPEKFFNVTNGVTPRRWMLLSNPRLSQLISSHIGENWVCHLEDLRKLEHLAKDSNFGKMWREVKQGVKRDLAAYVLKTQALVIDPESLFDVQVKRIHEYKRQHLSILHIITLYNRIKRNPSLTVTPRTFIFGGKAAPGYFMAKLIIKLINSVADVVNNDPDVNGRIKVVFLPNYNVTLGQRVYPAADLSEQISTAGKEASGTGNMKFGLNGAITIGTLDGANIEMREEVGEDNFFLFGLTAEQVFDLRSRGYKPYEYYQQNAELKLAIDQISSGYFSKGDPHLFTPLVDSLLSTDDFMLLADYQSYIDCQDKVSKAYLDQEQWTRMSILNVARMGKFSSDRSVLEYCRHIWQIKPVRVSLCEIDRR